MAKKEKKSLIIMDWVQLGITALIMSIVLYITITMEDTSSMMICMAIVAISGMFGIVSLSNLISDYNIQIKRGRPSLTPKKAL